MNTGTRATAASRARASVNLRFHRLAVAEIDREVDYYESHQVGLGVELEDEIDAALGKCRSPAGRRTALLERGPFGDRRTLTQKVSVGR